MIYFATLTLKYSDFEIGTLPYLLNNIPGISHVDLMEIPAVASGQSGTRVTFRVDDTSVSGVFQQVCDKVLPVIEVLASDGQIEEVQVKAVRESYLMLNTGGRVIR